VRPERSLGTQIGLGRGQQNERDRAMVKDPPIDLEEVVVGIMSLGSKDPWGALETVLSDGELNHSIKPTSLIRGPP
jgi:hypothetical protein